MLVLKQVFFDVYVYLKKLVKGIFFNIYISKENWIYIQRKLNIYIYSKKTNCHIKYIYIRKKCKTSTDLLVG